MQIGSAVIVGDLLGFVTDMTDETLTVYDKHRNSHTVNLQGAHEVANPNAISLMVYRKIFGGQ